MTARKRSFSHDIGNARMSRDIGDSARGIPRRSQAALGRGVEQVTFGDETEVQPLVAGPVERDEDGRADVAEHLTVAEHVVPYTAAALERAPGMALVAVGFGPLVVVAVAAPVGGGIPRALSPMSRDTRALRMSCKRTLARCHRGPVASNIRSLCWGGSEALAGPPGL